MASHLALNSIPPYPEAIAEGVITIVESCEEVLQKRKAEATVSPPYRGLCKGTT